MIRTVYLADKSLIFTSTPPSGGEWVVVRADDGGACRAKITKILERSKFVALVSDDPERSFEAFAADYTRVVAAGGVVVNECGEWLMIHRNGRWDLPKGHLEPGEELERCAEREIAEETGVRAEVVRPLCETLHAYYFPKTLRWELKCTHWYELRAATGDRLTPQHEEGIERVAWCSPEAVADHLCSAFPTICRVAEVMRIEK